MGDKYSFRIHGPAPRRDFPERIIVGLHDLETAEDIVLKGLACLLFHRERLQMDVNLHMDSIPFRPDIVQLDYELRPILWVECGECSTRQLDKLAVKVPEAAIWVVKGSRGTAEELLHAMSKAKLRQNRYQLLAFDAGMMTELCANLRKRNEIFWVRGGFDPPELQFDFNGLWFDGTFDILRY